MTRIYFTFLTIVKNHKQKELLTKETQIRPKISAVSIMRRRNSKKATKLADKTENTTKYDILCHLIEPEGNYNVVVTTTAYTVVVHNYRSCNYALPQLLLLKAKV